MTREGGVLARQSTSEAPGVMGSIAFAQPPRITLDPEDIKKGLGQLVLTVIQLIRELLERQALRRINAGSLTEEEIERLGLTFLRLGEQMVWLKNEFGLADEDLNLDLGPLGRLI